MSYKPNFAEEVEEMRDSEDGKLHFECWDCGETAEFDLMEEAVDKGWHRMRVGQGIDLCPLCGNSTRAAELAHKAMRGQL